MKKLNPISLLISLSLSWGLTPLSASSQPAYQVYPKTNPDDLNEELQWNPTSDRLGAACQVTANFNTCLSYYQLWCSQGFQEACNLQDLAATNPQFFQQAINLNSACSGGDQTACNWLYQQFGY